MQTVNYEYKEEIPAQIVLRAISLKEERQVRKYLLICSCSNFIVQIRNKNNLQTARYQLCIYVLLYIILFNVFKVSLAHAVTTDTGS